MTFGELPSWLIEGVALGLVLATAVLFVYLAGLRWFTLGRQQPTAEDPDRLRRAEVRAYLAAIGEPAVEGTAVADIPVDFWLPHRRVAITFDADVYFSLRDAEITAVLLEHEVPGESIGSRLPFETPRFERPTDDGDATSWAYETLEVDPDADWTTIKRAYRNKLKEVHPDHGGESTALMDVLDAYEHLADQRG